MLFLNNYQTVRKFSSLFDGTLNIILEVCLWCEKDDCINFMFIAYVSSVVNIDLSLSFLLYTRHFAPDYVQLFIYLFFVSWIALFPYFLSILMFTSLLLSFFLPFLPPHCVPLLPPRPSTCLWWVLQLALLQYRLSMSSMLCQPPAPPGSGTLHTYQVLLPFHSVPRASWR